MNMSAATEIEPVVDSEDSEDEEDELGPLPEGWEKRFDVTTNRPFFIDHLNCCTTWVDPRHHHQKVHAFALLPEDTDDLPYGWEAGNM